MSDKRSNSPPPEETVRRSISFEDLVKRTPPVFTSILLQLPTDSILALYHTSRTLRNFLRAEPTSWTYLSFRLFQPSTITTTNNNTSGSPVRSSGNYSLDQLFLFIVCPFSTCLKSLELDNTAVCGMVLSQTVLTLRRETLQHLSVRGCKNVSLKYHINPWLMMVKLTSFAPDGMETSVEYQKLALKSLYTYRCRHHRRRPYLPNSLTRKDSDSEPTHQLVNICHKLGIWTDTAWCTTPGGRCLRRRGYVTMRVPQDPREVWVVYDRLWRSRNWIGTVAQTQQQLAASINTPQNRKRKRDCRSWELEEAVRGEALGTGIEGKGLPAHLRSTHKEFVDEINCDNCSALILERCEQCSVTMHCSGCRKTLCASCAFDRPYLRNKNAPEEDRNKFWWAPGCAVSPCSMPDVDPTPVIPGAMVNPAPNNAGLPASKFKWCCAEPVFSGGGGITFGPGTSHDHEQIRAAPLPRGAGWEDPEFYGDSTKSLPTGTSGPGGRWKSIDSLFRRDELAFGEHSSSGVHRVLCDECYACEQWNTPCKSCSVPVCLKHDVQDKLRARVCGYKDLSVEKLDFRSRQKVVRLKFTTEPRTRTREQSRDSRPGIEAKSDSILDGSGKIPASMSPELAIQDDARADDQGPSTPSRQVLLSAFSEPSNSSQTPGSVFSMAPSTGATEEDLPVRPNTPGSNSTAMPSRASSPTPSMVSSSGKSDERPAEGRSRNCKDLPPDWSGCQSIFCPQNRGPGDHRRRCIAVFRQCLDCKVNVCGDCVTLIGPSCPCTGCRLRSGEDGTVNHMPGAIGDTIKFFCPNCRWQRRQNGTCKRRVALSGPVKQRKERYRKPLSERIASASTNNATEPIFPGFGDDAVEMAGEFLESLNLLEMTPAMEPPKPSVEETNEEIQELEDVGALARDLIRRIQRLREQFRPGSLAAAALPDIRVEESASSRREEGMPIVEDMD